MGFPPVFIIQKFFSSFVHLLISLHYNMLWCDVMIRLGGGRSARASTRYPHSAAAHKTEFFSLFGGDSLNALARSSFGWGLFNPPRRPRVMRDVSLRTTLTSQFFIAEM